MLQQDAILCQQQGDKCNSLIVSTFYVLAFKSNFLNLPLQTPFTRETLSNIGFRKTLHDTV